LSRMILFNGAVLVRAGGATKVDASAFESVGATGVGVVGLIGEADGGEPNAVLSFRDPDAMVKAFRSGPLADAADLAFRPMNDTRVPGGAVQVLAVKVNQSLQSAKTLLKGTSSVMTLKSIDYGAHTLKISAEVATSGGGKTIEIVYEDGITRLSEVSPVLGATAEFTVHYTGAGSAATLTVSDTQITTSVVGGPGGENLTIPFTTYRTLQEILNHINGAAGGVYTAVAVTRNPYTLLGSQLDRVSATDVKSSTASFYAQLYRIIEWVNANSALITAERSPATAGGATSGSVTGTGVATFNLEPSATLLIKVNGAGPTTATFTATAATRAGSGGTFATMASETFKVQFESGDVQTVTFGTEDSLAAAVNLINSQIRGGRAVINATQVDIVSDVRGTSSRARTSDVAAGVSSKLGILNSGDSSGTGNVANIEAVTSAEAKTVIEAAVTGLTYSTVGGYPVLTSNTTGTGSTVQVTSGTAQAVFGFDALEHAGTNAGAPNGAGAPDDVGPVFLTGGVRGVSSNTNWQDAFDLLAKVRVNQAVPLISEDLVNEGYGSTATWASVAAAADSFAAWCSSTKGKNECEVFLGMKATKTQLLAQAGTLQSPHSVLTGQYVTRANYAGDLTQFPAWGVAVIAAGGRAGSSLGEPLTWKNMRCSGLTQDSSWNPEDDGDDIILGGVTFAFSQANLGYKFDRVITTYSKSDNDAFVEESIVQGWKNVAYGLRYDLETAFTGVRGLPATVQTIKDRAKRKLEAYRDEGQIVDSQDADGQAQHAWRNLTVTLDGDVNRLSVTISPVAGINFELQTLFLAPASLSA